jgi:hypothetical protein
MEPSSSDGTRSLCCEMPWSPLRLEALLRSTTSQPGHPIVNGRSRWTELDDALADSQSWLWLDERTSLLTVSLTDAGVQYL